jgi:hypothetical protein
VIVDSRASASDLQPTRFRDRHCGSASDSLSETIRAALAALDAGDLGRARALLVALVDAKESNE